MYIFGHYTRNIVPGTLEVQDKQGPFIINGETKMEYEPTEGNGTKKGTTVEVYLKAEMGRAGRGDRAKTEGTRQLTIAEQDAIRQNKLAVGKI